MITGKLFLIVEDDPPIRTLLISLLYDYSPQDIDSCSSAEEAIEKLKHKKYDCIILDLLLPGKYNGIDVLKFLVDNQISMPVLIYTGVPEIDPEIFKIGLVKFLTIEVVHKPIDLKMLTKAIKGVMHTHACKNLEHVLFPALKQEVNELKDEMKELKEKTVVKEMKKAIIKAFETDKIKIAIGVITGLLLALTGTLWNVFINK